MISEATRHYWQTRSGTWRAAPPFTPGQEDIDWFTRCLIPFRQAARCEALLLGVTPELARLAWPAGTRLHAVDQSPGMLRNVWSPPAGVAVASGICGDWLAMPLPDSSKDVAVSDGCYTALGSFDEAARLNAELVRVLRPGGLFCMRSFIRPARAEEPRRLFDELLAGAVRDENLFRWRLAAALQGASRAGVLLDDVWRCWREHVPNAGDPAMERWRGVRIRFYFPTVSELEELAGADFEVIGSETPGYAGWGERLHRICLRRALRRSSG